jgi:hypothetical protein
MSTRLKTLVLDADGAGWAYAAVDTTLRGILRLRADSTILPGPLRAGKWARRLLGPRYGHLSYVLDWREALCSAPELDAEVCNINDLVAYRNRREAIREYPLVIILHSAAGDSMALLRKTAHWFDRRRGKLAVFLGNEYDLMDEKIAFLRSVGAEYVCSQLPLEAARWVYPDSPSMRIISLPHALNPSLYRPDPAVQRTVDIGFCGDIYYHFVGDLERTTLIRLFQEHGADLGMITSIRLNARMGRPEWARFLNGCRGTIGAESGSYYLDRHGQLIQQAKRYQRRHPGATFEEIFERFFRAPEVPYVSGKTISSRHFEPIGTKTCQLLLEGHYNGILRPSEHYIPVKRDLSDIGEATRRFKDGAERTRIVERAYEYVMDQHTYEHRVRALVRIVGGASSA